MIAVTTLEVVATVDYTGGRPWSEQWRRVKRLFADVGAIYYGTFAPASNEAWKDAVSNFFVACYHQYEWLASDASLGATMQRDVRTFVETNADLRLAEAFTNTYKHHTRTRGTEAVIGGTTSGPGANSVRVDWTELTTGDTGSVDALELATNCMDAWRHFLGSHALDPNA